MIKIVVNATKGGVGKTTLATNTALYLAQQGYKVWALDLARRSRMSRYLTQICDFNNSIHKIDNRENEELPQSFPGSRKFDFLVADTDDDYEVPFTVVTSQGWRLIIPIVPAYDELGVEDIAEQTASILKFGLITENTPKARICVNNRFPADNYAELYEELYTRLENYGIEEFIATLWLPYVAAKPPNFCSNFEYILAVKNVLNELDIL